MSESLGFSFIEEMTVELKYLPKDHGYRYDMSNCLFEATFEHILEVSKNISYGNRDFQVSIKGVQNYYVIRKILTKNCSKYYIFNFSLNRRSTEPSESDKI